MDIRLHRVYGIITEATQRMRVGTGHGRESEVEAKKGNTKGERAAGRGRKEGRKE